MSAHHDPRERALASWGVDVALSLFFVGVGALAILDSRRLGAGWGADGPQSGYFPFLIGALLIGGALVNLANALRDRAAGVRDTFVNWGQFRLVLVMMVPTAIYIAAIPFLGIYLASAILAAAYLHFLGGYRWWMGIAFGVAVALVAFLVFDIWFLVSLPKGPIEHALGY